MWRKADGMWDGAAGLPQATHLIDRRDRPIRRPPNRLLAGPRLRLGQSQSPRTDCRATISVNQRIGGEPGQLGELSAYSYERPTINPHAVAPKYFHGLALIAAPTRLEQCLYRSAS